MRQPVQVLVYPACVEADGTRYLLLQRVPRPDIGLDGFWQGVTGGVEAGESLIEAAGRELREETGLIPTGLWPIGFSYSYPIQESWRMERPPEANEIEEHAFLALVQGRPAPALSREHRAWRWCRPVEALALLKYPDNKTALERCESFLRERSGL
jgi:dATP pyrophosphohydrolase